ncbi:ABC transporter substrate-binding protein [Undibacterium arcticum]
MAVRRARGRPGRTGGCRQKKSGKYDIDGKVAGFELLDPYTLRIHLTHPDYNLGMILAHTPSGAVAREVVEKYQDAQGLVMDHPVGTGPYMLTQWVRQARIVLEANPDYRGLTWDFQAGSDPEDQRIVAQMKGKKIPQIGRIEISVMLEDQSRWLAFQNREVDLFQLEGPLAPKALAGGKLLPELAAKGVQLSRIIDPETSVYYWNMQDSVTGGFSKEKNRVAPGDGDGAQRAGRHRHHLARRGSGTGISDPARYRRSRSSLQEQHPV